MDISYNELYPYVFSDTILSVSHAFKKGVVLACGTKVLRQTVLYYSTNEPISIRLPSGSAT